MKAREMRKQLLEAGFYFVRNGKRHELWSNGREQLALSHGSNTSPRTLKSFLSKMRKYKRELACSS